MLEIGSDNIFLLNRDIVLKAIGGENFYALDLSTGDHFKLNCTSYWILESLTTPMAFSFLQYEFGHHFCIPESQAAEDLYEVVMFAVNNNILKEVKDEE